MTTKTTELKTYTEEEMRRIVEFSSAVERLRERAISSMNLALQRARAAGDAKESVAALEWMVSNIELCISAFVNQAQQAKPEPETKPEEPAPED